MTDTLCLIPPKHIADNKYYSNITELCLRSDETVGYLRRLDIDASLCSDYELFVKMCELAKSDASRVSEAFMSTLHLFGFNKNALQSPDEIWEKIADALSSYEWSLWGLIEKSGLSRLGVPFDDSLPDMVGSTSIDKIKIAETVFFDTNTLPDAVFLNDFEFEKPNLYAAQKAKEKYTSNATLKDSERKILKSQNLREYLFICAERGKAPMLFLPPSPDVDTLCQIKLFFDYMDATDISPMSLTLFAPELVSYQFARSLNYKKIKAEAAISGNGLGFVNSDEIKYWGGVMPKRQASLATTGAAFIAFWNFSSRA